MGQTWDALLFAHYRVPVSALRELVPDGLQVQEHSGSGWLGVTPFAVMGLRARGLPPLPLVSSFLELNVRTYVTRDEKPGIWFFSLDASSDAAVRAARRLYRLPYFKARIRMERAAEVTFESTRDAQTAFDGSYSTAGPVVTADSGSLEHFFTERYCLYAEHAGELLRAEIHHRPWPLQAAEAQIRTNTMAPAGIEIGEEPLLHYSERQDVVIWPLESVE